MIDVSNLTHLQAAIALLVERRGENGVRGADLYGTVKANDGAIRRCLIILSKSGILNKIDGRYFCALAHDFVTPAHTLCASARFCNPSAQNVTPAHTLCASARFCNPSAQKPVNVNVNKLKQTNKQEKVEIENNGKPSLTTGELAVAPAFIQVVPEGNLQRVVPATAVFSHTQPAGATQIGQDAQNTLETQKSRITAYTTPNNVSDDVPDVNPDSMPKHWNFPGKIYAAGLPRNQYLDRMLADFNDVDYVVPKNEVMRVGGNLHELANVSPPEYFALCCRKAQELIYRMPSEQYPRRTLTEKIWEEVNHRLAFAIAKKVPELAGENQMAMFFKDIPFDDKKRGTRILYRLRTIFYHNGFGWEYLIYKTQQSYLFEQNRAAQGKEVRNAFFPVYNTFANFLRNKPPVAVPPRRNEIRPDTDTLEQLAGSAARPVPEKRCFEKHFGEAGKMFDALAEFLGPSRFDQWFGTESEIRLTETNFVFQVKNKYTSDWIRSNLSEKIRELSLSIFGKDYPAVFEVLTQTP